jgi:hypothetical protein
MIIPGIAWRKGLLSAVHLYCNYGHSQGRLWQFCNVATGRIVIRRHLVGYTRLERRRDRRRPIELAAAIDGRPATIVDVSLGGLRLAAVTVRAAAARSFQLGEQHRVTLDVPSYGPLELLAEVARIDSAGSMLGLRFVGLDLASYRVIERLAIGRPVTPQRR